MLLIRAERHNLTSIASLLASLALSCTNSLVVLFAVLGFCNTVVPGVRTGKPFALCWKRLHNGSCSRFLLAQTLLRQIVMRLSPHPESGVAPADSLQRQRHSR